MIILFFVQVDMALVPGDDFERLSAATFSMTRMAQAPLRRCAIITRVPESIARANPRIGTAAREVPGYHFLFPSDREAHQRSGLWPMSHEVLQYAVGNADGEAPYFVKRLFADHGGQYAGLTELRRLTSTMPVNLIKYHNSVVDKSLGSYLDEEVEACAEGTSDRR